MGGICSRDQGRIGLAGAVEAVACRQPEGRVPATCATPAALCVHPVRQRLLWR